jgi:hypothetical protein
MSCYVCRQIITGYDHFNSPHPHTGAKGPNTCILWDTGETRTYIIAFLVQNSALIYTYLQERTTRSVNDPACALLNGSLTDMRNGQVAVAARNALQKYKLEHPDEVSGTLETDFPELLGSPTSRRRATNATRAALPEPPPQPPPPLNLHGIAYPGAPYNYPPPAIQHYPMMAPVLPLRAQKARTPLPRRRLR